MKVTNPTLSAIQDRRRKTAKKTHTKQCFHPSSHPAVRDIPSLNHIAAKCDWKHSYLVIQLRSAMPCPQPVFCVQKHNAHALESLAPTRQLATARRHQGRRDRVSLGHTLRQNRRRPLYRLKTGNGVSFASAIKVGTFHSATCISDLSIAWTLASNAGDRCDALTFSFCLQLSSLMLLLSLS